MKKFFLSFLLLASPLWAATSYTTRVGIPKPADQDQNWGTTLRSAFDIIDSSMALLSGSAFTGPVTFSSDVVISSPAFYRVWINTPTYSGSQVLVANGDAKFFGPLGGVISLCDQNGANCTNLSLNTSNPTSGLNISTITITNAIVFPDATVQTSAVNGGPTLASTQTWTGQNTFSYIDAPNGYAIDGTTVVYLNSGLGNLGLGENALHSSLGAGGTSSVGVGYWALRLNDTGAGNVGVGYRALPINTTGNNNTGIGSSGLGNNTFGNNNTSIGTDSGITNGTGSNNLFLGAFSDAGSASLTNATAIGYGAMVSSSYTMQLGATSGTNAVTVNMSTFTASSGTVSGTFYTGGNVESRGKSLYLGPSAGTAIQIQSKTSALNSCNINGGSIGGCSNTAPQLIISTWSAGANSSFLLDAAGRLSVGSQLGPNYLNVKGTAYIGNAGTFPTVGTTQFEVQAATTATYSIKVGTGVLTGSFIAISTSSEINLNGSVGTNGQVLTSAGTGSVPTWTTVSSAGGGNGVVNAANQNAVPYYSVSGSSNVLSGATNLTNDGTTVLVYGKTPLVSTGSLQSGATLYVSSVTVSGTLTTTGNTILGNTGAQVFIPSVGSLTPSLQFVRSPTGGALTASGIGSSDLSWASTNYILLTPTLQTDAIFYVSSGTVNTSFTTNGTAVHNGGISISSGITVSTPSAYVTSTMTITSTMSVILASPAAGNAKITLTLPDAATNPGLDMMIYKVDSSTVQVVIQGAGTDMIESTGTAFLNAKFQHASLHSLGSAGWGSGLGGIQYTPHTIQTVSMDNAAYITGTSSIAVQCPVYNPVPSLVTAFRADKSAGGGFLSFGIFDRNGRYLIGVSTVATVAGPNNYSLTTPFQLAPGWYKVAVMLSNVGIQLTGSNSLADVTSLCSVGATPTNMDISAVTLTTGGNRNIPDPFVALILNGGVQAN